MDHDRKRLLSAARRLLRSRADAEDAVQDTLLRALTALRDETAGMPWLQTVLRNIAIDRLRRRRLETQQSETEFAPAASAEDVVELRARCEAALRHLLSRTNPSEAAAILLREVFEFDHAQLASLLGKTEAACRQYLKRSKMRIDRVDRTDEADELYVRCCWLAIEARDPARLVDMVRIGVSARARSDGDSRSGTCRSHTTLVQVNGRYALALVLDGVVLCVVPLGVHGEADAGLLTAN